MVIYSTEVKMKQTPGLKPRVIQRVTDGDQPADVSSGHRVDWRNDDDGVTLDCDLIGHGEQRPAFNRAGTDDEISGQCTEVDNPPAILVGDRLGDDIALMTREEVANFDRRSRGGRGQ